MRWFSARVADRKRRAETRGERASFERVRNAEVRYGSQLRSVARQIGAFAQSFDPDEPTAMTLLRALLERYAEAIRPWATATAERMLVDVSRRDEAVWNALARDMSRSLADEIKNAPTGEMLRRLLNEQVVLITSLPRTAAQRVHKLTLEGMESGTRAKEIATEIRRSGKVSESRAMLIARTEVARTASGLVQARSVYAGSEGYKWRTADDESVRKEHRKLAGKFIRWDSPPVAGPNGMRYHAGQGPNCRCYPEPVIPDEQ